VSLLLADPRVDANVVDDNSCSPLADAVRKGRLDVVRAFLADPGRCAPTTLAAARGYASGPDRPVLAALLDTALLDNGAAQNASAMPLEGSPASWVEVVDESQLAYAMPADAVSNDKFAVPSKILFSKVGSPTSSAVSQEAAGGSSLRRRAAMALAEQKLAAGVSEVAVPPPAAMLTVTVTAVCAAEHPGDLALATGDVVVVTDNSDPTWWKGYKQSDTSKAVGTFPHNHTVTNCEVGASVVAMEGFDGPEPGASKAAVPDSA
jgi:hypothetical protein